MTDEKHEIYPIAHIESDFPEKFGIPRQSGLVNELRSRIVFVPKYRNDDALRGIQEYSHLWLLWQFSQVAREREADDWKPTVRPPRLGGNTRVGVFASRSPFRPNTLGLSCVKLERVEHTKNDGTVLWVQGADLLNNTPIYDIKPYLPYVDSHPEATGSFSDQAKTHRLQVECAEEFLKVIPSEKRGALLGVLESDPRPAYQQDGRRVYGMDFAGYTVRFRVEGRVLYVVGIIEKMD